MNSGITCPNCFGNEFILKREATYVYSYLIDEDQPGLSNTDIFYSFQYDRRERTAARSYIECNQCGQQIACRVYPDNNRIRVTCLDTQML